MVVNDSSRHKVARTFPQILSEAYVRPATTNSCKLYVIRYYNAVPMETFIDHKKLFWTTVPCSYMAKRVFNIRLAHFQHFDNQSLGFISGINRILTKYALHHVLDRYLSDGVFMEENHL